MPALAEVTRRASARKDAARAQQDARKQAQAEAENAEAAEAAEEEAEEEEDMDPAAEGAAAEDAADDGDEEAAEEEEDMEAAEDGDDSEKSAAARQARGRERRRVARVMRHAAAKGREATAVQLLTGTGLSSKAIVAVLETTPKDKAGKKGNDFLAAMNGSKGPKIGSDAETTPAAGNYGWDNIAAKLNRRRK